MQTGPNFKLLPNCNECEFAKFNFLIGENKTGLPVCIESGPSIQLNTYRNLSLIEPHNECPFIDKNEKNYHKEKLKLIAEKELAKEEEKLNKLIESIRLMFPDLRSIQYGGDLSTLFITARSFYLERLNDLNKEIPNNSFSVKPCYIGNNDIGVEISIVLKK